MNQLTSAQHAELSAQLTALGPILNNLIARLQDLADQYGPTLLAELPTILIGLGVPVWLVPFVTAIVTGLLHKSPAVAPTA